jgi:uncharacterized protein YgbK (DUF1537 family)
MGVPDAPPTDTVEFEVIALKCRTAPVDEAVAECLAALAWLKQAGSARFFWKYCSTFDSTATGNIGPVAEALMADLELNQTIYCPAFPENGRSIFMGNLFVGTQLLAESPMKDHPLTPMRDSNLMRLLTPQTTAPVGLADRLCVTKGVGALQARLHELRQQGVAHVVVDAVADDDLKTIANACCDMPLITGGSAVAMPLPSIYMAQGLLEKGPQKTTVPQIGVGAIILSGSCSAMTRAQVKNYAEIAPSYQLDPLDLAQNGVQKSCDWLIAQSNDVAPMIYATADPATVQKAQDQLGMARAGELVEQALATLAIEARNNGTRRFVVAGGETSGAVAKALGVTQMAIGAEIAPGVPWGYGQSDGVDIALALKSGNFGTENFFNNALAKLEP